MEKKEDKISGVYSSQYKSSYEMPKMQIYNEYRITRENTSVTFRKCIHEIRNMKNLDKTILGQINSMSNDEKMEIIVVMNEIIQTMKQLID